MAEKQQTSKSTDRIKRQRQPISIPFVWEEIPGTPIKDWKPAPRPVQPIDPPVDPPVKLVVSIPFGWEEKPGTPLPYIAQPQDLFESESDTDDESFTSAPSLLRNGGVCQVASPDSPAYVTDGSFNAESSRSLAGASFLEWLFPLLATNSSSTENKCLSRTEDAKDRELFRGESNNSSSQVRRPLLTLGELIVMSRRMSCRRKVVKMHKQSSLDFMKGDALGCCIFGGANGGIGGLHRKLKKQLLLN